MNHAKRALRAALPPLIAAALWVPSLHLFFDARASAEGRREVADALRAQQTRTLADPARRGALRARMRGANAEWDFMGRTFTVLALANDALEHPVRRAADLAAIDAVLEETITLEAERGQRHFLMGYADRAPFEDPSGRSVFVDGEVALMLAARLRVAADERWALALQVLTRRIASQMERGPVQSAESYPDECWTFCNAAALAALRVNDSVTGEDHSPLMRAWVRAAREHLLDERSGLLISSFTHDGERRDGPEGSSIFFAAHMLQIVDPDFAADQYRRARSELGLSFAGFGWAREWPAADPARPDIDSGPIVPIVDASAGASGMALLGAASFGDELWLRALHRSLGLAAFPVEDEQGFRFAASNQVGDAVLLYSLAQGPLWRLVGPPPDRARGAQAANGGAR